MSHSLTPLSHPLLADHERQRCEVWTRVMGYHRPMASFNVGKQGEFHERRYFVAGDLAQLDGAQAQTQQPHLAQSPRMPAHAAAAPAEAACA